MLDNVLVGLDDNGIGMGLALALVRVALHRAGQEAPSHEDKEDGFLVHPNKWIQQQLVLEERGLSEGYDVCMHVNFW